MPQVFYTRLESKIEQGKLFIFNTQNETFAQSASDDLVITTGDEEITIEEIRLQADAFDFSYQIFLNPTFDDQSGTAVAGLPTNSSKPSLPALSVISNPTITDDGTPSSPPLLILGKSRSNVRSYIDTKLTDTQFVLAKNTSYLIRLNNLDAATRTYTLAMTTTKY